VNARPYSVLIRTFNSEKTLPATLESLRRQSCPPAEYVLVDSGSTDGTLGLAPKGAVVRRYEGVIFNYSQALNQGIASVSTEYVLILSSHTSIQNDRAVEYALDLLADGRIGAAYFCNENRGALRHVLIDRRSFDGFNGLWNTSGMVKTPLVRRRGFRPEVFTAEDQEWSKWLVEQEGKAIARIYAGGAVSANARARSVRKRANEYASIAYFVRPDLLRWRSIARIGLGAVRRHYDAMLSEPRVCLAVFVRLVLCRLVQPRFKSRYY